MDGNIEAQTLRANRWIWLAIIVALAARLGAYVFLALRPITFDPYRADAMRARLLSPFEVAGIDIEHYTNQAELIARGEWWIHNFWPGFTPPITPFLLWLFDYGPGHTVPVSIFWFGLSAFWVVGWLVWLRRRDLPGPWLALFAIMPVPVFYQFAIGTDLPFAVLFLLFYASYRGDIGPAWIWPAALIAMAMTRAAAFSVMLFLLLDYALSRFRTKRIDIGKLVLLVSVGGLAFALYWPWLLTFVAPSIGKGTAVYNIPYYGVGEARYLEGLFSDYLPAMIDKPMSWLLLVFAKLLYFCGFRPSFDASSILASMLRSASALVIVPGLFQALYGGDTRDRLLVVAFVLPVLLGVAQERYSLPILPILFLYGVAVWGKFFGSIIQRQGKTTAL